MGVLIVYESLYGTNQRIAEAIAAGFGAEATVTLTEARSAPPVVEADLDLVVVGGPNHKARLPSPSRTRASSSRATG